MAQGLLVFRSMKEAEREGFLPYDRLAGGGYLVRRKTAAGWQLAIVDPARNADDPLPDIADPDEQC